MDGLGFDDASKKEIQAALVQGQRQAQAHSQLLAFTSMCWDKLKHFFSDSSFTSHPFNRCITGTPGSRFARGEEACIANCIERFVDSSEYLLGMVQRQQQLQQTQKS
ncbi:hypothetical protein JVT61DRAFT_5769 [Boletus reticuloceps]|uniref:Mitochondrial import inner membrane translocase subunit n=1 Tax=Boletus reticuloceps TaxID=495285 RepID=A0A8I2YZM7_9AGAM|nr:hypothetical protein JVT61DRAFT_5769 [Boletus reticuloceps]